MQGWAGWWGCSLLQGCLIELLLKYAGRQWKHASLSSECRASRCTRSSTRATAGQVRDVSSFALRDLALVRPPTRPPAPHRAPLLSTVMNLPYNATLRSGTFQSWEAEYPGRAHERVRGTRTAHALAVLQQCWAATNPLRTPTCMQGTSGGFALQFSASRHDQTATEKYIGNGALLSQSLPHACMRLAACWVGPAASACVASLLSSLSHRRCRQPRRRHVRLHPGDQEAREPLGLPHPVSVQELQRWGDPTVASPYCGPRPHAAAVAWLLLCYLERFLACASAPPRMCRYSDLLEAMADSLRATRTYKDQEPQLSASMKFDFDRPNMALTL